MDNGIIVPEGFHPQADTTSGAAAEAPVAATAQQAPPETAKQEETNMNPQPSPQGVVVLQSPNNAAPNNTQPQAQQTTGYVQPVVLPPPNGQAQPQVQPQVQPVHVQPQQVQQPVHVQPQQAQPQVQPQQVQQPVHVQPQQPVQPQQQVFQPAPQPQPTVYAQPQQAQPMQVYQPQNTGQQMQPYQPQAQQPVGGYGGDPYETTIDDDSLAGLQVFPKLAKGQKKRISMLLFNADNTVRIKSFQKIFCNDLKKDFQAPVDDPELLQLATDEFGPPKLTIYALLFDYYLMPDGRAMPQMDANNQLIPDSISGQAMPAGDIYLWRISREKLPPVRTINKEFGLTRADMIIECLDDNFQKWSIQAARERLLNNSPGFLQQVTAKANDLWNMEVPRLISKRLDRQGVVTLINENRELKRKAAGPSFGGPGGQMVDPFAAAGRGQPSQHVGFGQPVHQQPQGQPQIAAPQYHGHNTGVEQGGFGDMIADMSQAQPVHVQQPQPQQTQQVPQGFIPQ